MPTITKTEDGSTITYFYDGVKKYVHHKGSDSDESWREYDERGNEVHYKNLNGYEWWSEYDNRWNEVHFKNSNGYEWCREYDEGGNEVHHKDSSGYEWWSDDHPNKPKNVPVTEDDVHPFQFGNH